MIHDIVEHFRKSMRTNTKNIFFGICQQRLDLFRPDDIFLEIRSYI